jgi:uncharacterized protein (TIGR00730 family)
MAVANGLAELLQKTYSLLNEVAERRFGAYEIKFLYQTLYELSESRRIFENVRGTKVASIFGSARTAPDHPAFKQAVEMARLLVSNGWKIMTGAGNGIMEAGHLGAGREHSLGVNISLPFEQQANPHIINSPLLTVMKYFFTRKITFLEFSKAIVVCQGGWGSFDEAFEALTLMQTGKSPIIPVIFLDIPGSNYWKDFFAWQSKYLLGNRYIGAQDFSLLLVTDSIQKASDEITNFYKRHHSVYHDEGLTYIRMLNELTEEQISVLNSEFTDLLKPDYKFSQITEPIKDPEDPELNNLPRIFFDFERRKIGRLRELINRINSF